MSFDLDDEYKKAQKKIKAVKDYTDVKKNQYENAKKVAGDSFEQVKQDVTKGIGEAKDQVKRYQKQVKNQFEQLLDINNLTGGKGSNSIQYIKKLLITTVKNIEPQIAEIIHQEAIIAIGCDQQQEFSGQTLYIKIKSIDIGNLLKIDPNSDEGKVLYEKFPIQVQIPPFSMNRELYNRIQNGSSSYSNQYAQNYLGISGQELFDIQFAEFDNFGQTGPWYKITLKNRTVGANKVSEFLVDYYKTIRIVEFQCIMANIMEQLCGALSMSLDVGINQIQDANFFQKMLMRILGLCFDNKSEIDVSGISKLAELDGIDDSFFEFTSIDLRDIDQKVTNIKNKVVEFEDCDNIKLPVDYQAVIQSLNSLIFVAGTPKEVEAAESVTNALTDNPLWNGVSIQANLQVAVNLNFVKLIAQGLIVSVMSPKVLLPIFIMLKSLGNDAVNAITGYMDFIRAFRKYMINIVSKIGAIFVKELFELIKKDIKQLLQQVIMDVAKEKGDKRIIIILKLIQLLLVVAQFISDWRRCKSVIDELLWLLRILGTGWGGEIPLPLLYASQLLDGYSESRAFLATIEELQKIGVPTGPMPDGSPNLELLSKFSQMKAMAQENAENGKVQVAVGPLTITPAGLTVPASAFGKGF